MEVSGVGGVGLAAGAGLSTGVSASSPATNSVSPGTADAIAKSAPPPQSVAEYYSGVQAENIQEVLNQLEGFSMAELLIALMILAGGNQEKQDQSGGSSALDFLAGMAVGNYFSQQSQLFQASPAPTQSISATPIVGQTLDISV